MGPTNQNISLGQRVIQFRARIALATAMIFGGGAAVAQSTVAGASTNTGYHPSTTTTIDDSTTSSTVTTLPTSSTTEAPNECLTGQEADGCPTTTTAPPSTTTSTSTTTTAPATTTTSSTTTTTQVDEICNCDDARALYEENDHNYDATVAELVDQFGLTEQEAQDLLEECDIHPPVVLECADFEAVLAAETDPDEFNAYWNAILHYSEQTGVDYDTVVQFVQEECEICPPEPTTTTTLPTTTTTTMPTTTTSTTSTTLPTTTTSTTSTTLPTTTSTTSTTVAPSTTTSTTLLIPGSTTIPPATPATPVPAPAAPQGELPRTGIEADLLTLIGGSGIVTGSGLVVASVRSKNRKSNDKVADQNVVAGGSPDPDDIAVVTTPLTGEEIEQTNIDTLAEELVAEPAQLYVQGENRIDALKGNTKYSNVPDALLPASLRLNPEQSAPIKPIVASAPEIAPAITPEVAPVVARDPFEGYRFAPSRVR